MLATIVLSLVITALVGLAIRSLVKDHKRGNVCGYCKECAHGCKQSGSLATKGKGRLLSAKEEIALRGDVR